MSLNTFTFNGVNSWNYGIYIGGQNTFNAPQRIVSKTSIPGRNGDLVRDEGRFANILVPYNVIVMNEFRERTDEIKEWLLSPSGYCELSDTYHPHTFRMGYVTGGIDFETSSFNLTGKTQITFDCMPQRFLNSGVPEYGIDSPDDINSYLKNPTAFDSKPIITVVGSGDCTFMVNDQIITIDDLNGHVTIDCETMNCYGGVGANDTENMNGKVHFGSKGFPVLKGKAIGQTEYVNRVIPGTNVTEINVRPRWWTI